MGKNTCGGKTTTTNQRGSAGSLVDLDQGKKSSANFVIYRLPFTDEISPFVGKKGSQNIVRTKDDKVGNKTGYKKKGK